MIQRAIEAAEPSLPLRELGGELRILAAFIDALILGVDLDAAWDHPLVKTAILMESGERSQGWNEDRATRRLREWGVVDQDGIYLLARLTKRQTQVAKLYFDRQMEPRDIAKALNCDAITVRRHLQNIRERLAKLNSRSD